jgi:hypothetical protein
MQCPDLPDSYRYPAHRVAVRARIASCDACRSQYQSYFDRLHDDVVDAADSFVASANAYLAFSAALADACGRTEQVDAPRHIAAVLSKQVQFEFEHYYQERPDDNIVALCWLQKVFVLCRVFGSETLIERETPFIAGKPFVGKMPVPSQPSFPAAATFADATSLLQPPVSPELFGLPVFNPVLQASIEAEVKARQFVHALTLICDSPKHGVLSSLINLSATSSLEFAYYLGLKAASEAIRSYLASISSAFGRQA